MYFFVAAAAVALFTFLSTAHWVTTRAEERKTRERFALLRKIADQPTDTAKLLLEQLREDELRQEQKGRRSERQRRRDNLQGGLILLAVGAGLSIMLATVAPGEGVWTVGLIPGLMAVVVLLFALFDKSESGQ
jgi:hypothetical protein